MSLRALAGLALVAALAACSSVDKPKPTPLESYTPVIAGSLAWQARLEGIGFPLAVAARPDQFVAAGNDGTVLALDPGTGRELWRANAGGPLAAGVGSDGRFASVVTRNNELVVFEAGVEKWRKRANQHEIDS